MLLRPGKPIIMGPKAKEKHKIKMSKWSIKCVQNVLLCHPVNCISTQLHAYIENTLNVPCG